MEFKTTQAREPRTAQAVRYSSGENFFQDDVTESNYTQARTPVKSF